MAEQRFRVRELAQRCGVNTRTVDYYTTLGLLTPVARSAGGHRFYDAQEERRLHAIKAMREQGWTLEAIAAHFNDRGGTATLLPRAEYLNAELRRVEAEVTALASQIAEAPSLDAEREERARRLLQASLTSAAAFALAVAQQLADLLNTTGFGPL